MSRALERTSPGGTIRIVTETWTEHVPRMRANGETVRQLANTLADQQEAMLRICERYLREHARRRITEPEQAAKYFELCPAKYNRAVHPVKKELQRHLRGF